MKKILLMSNLLSLILIIVNGSEGFSQNVGIGTTSPSGKLQVNHRSGLATPGLLMMDSTTSRSGHLRFRNINSIKYMELWVYSGNSFSSAEQYLDVQSDSTFIATFRGNGSVGINNLTPVERLDVNGNINLTGMLKVNGNAGTAGQVLTSNGAADPQWKNAAYSNNSRFAADIPTNTGTGDLTYSTYYNLNPADVTISGSTLTINKAGLWHFEGVLHIRITWSAPPVGHALLATFIADGFGYPMIKDGVMERDSYVPTVTYVKTLHFSHNVYMSAASSVEVIRQIFVEGSPTVISRYTQGVISGYLISE